ncbi:acylphosphatase-2 isoform X2 [Rhinatrema bivittatum]|uniref:acylphosphatase-2 isoform X2 n=1 Tax=Rhinatrema bivittatum TaxID=194408 RepID=UPI00112D7227|nr:acylphosphatase-2 isoform X2 [Rhinatrema bivittatum]
MELGVCSKSAAPPSGNCCMGWMNIDSICGCLVSGFGVEYTEDEARKLGVVGWVKNTRQGTVVGQVQGPEDKVNSMIFKMRYLPCGSAAWERYSNTKFFDIKIPAPEYLASAPRAAKNTCGNSLYCNNCSCLRFRYPENLACLCHSRTGVCHL